MSLPLTRTNTSERPTSRSLHERLVGNLRHTDEALSPRLLRRILTELQAVLDSAALGRAVGAEPVTAADLLAGADQASKLYAKAPLRHFLMQCAAHYLGRRSLGQRLQTVVRHDGQLPVRPEAAGQVPGAVCQQQTGGFKRD